MQNLAPDHKNPFFFDSDHLVLSPLCTRRNLSVEQEKFRDIVANCTISPCRSENVRISCSLLSNPIQSMLAIKYPKYTHSWVREKTREAHKSNREPPLLPVCPCLLPLKWVKAMPSKACTYSHSVSPPQTQLRGCSENRRDGQPTPFHLASLLPLGRVHVAGSILPSSQPCRGLLLS